MRTLRVPVYWILALLFFSANGALGAPLLNGMAVHQELSRDQFIGALYSETLSSDASELLAADHPMRMELKITAERGIAARKFSRMWIEGMAINIRGSALTEQADNMVAFTQMFQERLLENDHVVFALNPGEGVAISVNSITLGTIPDDNFFGLLLSTWLGRVPLSSTYREQLLVAGDVSASLTGRYASISPTPERIDQVALWGAPEPEPEPEPAPEPEPKEEVAVAPVVVPATAVANKPKIEIPPTPSATPSTASEASSEATRVESSIAAVASSSSSVASSTAPAAPKEEPVDESDEDFVPTFTAESILANQRYFSNLVRKVQGEISYPRRAMQRGYEGSIRIAISINRQGELLNATLIEQTEHDMLNDEAMGAVESAEPFPEVPELITGQRHEFTIPITFTLQQQ